MRMAHVRIYLVGKKRKIYQLIEKNETFEPQIYLFRHWFFTFLFYVTYVSISHGNLKQIGVKYWI